MKALTMTLTLLLTAGILQGCTSLRKELYADGGTQARRIADSAGRLQSASLEDILINAEESRAAYIAKQAELGKLDSPETQWVIDGYDRSIKYLKAKIAEAAELDVIGLIRDAENGKPIE